MSWNFILTFSRTGMEKEYRSWKVLEICLTQEIKFSKFMLYELQCRSLRELILKSWYEGFKVKFEVVEK